MVNGEIRSHQTLPIDGMINFSTVNGNIYLEVPRNTSADFSATMTNGSFSTSNLDFKNQVISRTFVQGTLGSGQGKIKFSTVNGKLSIAGF
jgi:DUF4097 and DUF4098 domain-containing protein YvlB